MEKDYVGNEVQVPLLDGALFLIVFQYFAKDAEVRVLGFEILFLDVYDKPQVGLAGVEEDVDETHLAGIGEIVVEKFLSSLSQAAKVLALLADNFLDEVDLLIVLILVLDIIVY